MGAPPADPTADPPARPSRLTSAGRAVRDTTFRSLRHRDYRLYFTGQLVSFTGTWVQSAALWYLAYDVTRDGRWPPLLLVAGVLPTLVLGPWAGRLADRVPKKRLIFRTQAGFLGVAAVLAGVTAAGAADPWLLLAVQVAHGLIQAVDLPARLAFVPDLVPRADLINAVSLNSLLFNAARAVGPGVAGAVFVAAGAAAGGGRAVAVGAVCCFALNAVSYAAVLVALRRIGATGDRPAADPRAADPAAGWAVVRRPAVAGVLVATGLLSVFGWPALTLFPAYTAEVLHKAEAEYSLLLTGVGAGALAGALTTATVGTAGRRGPLLTAGAGLAAAGLTGLTAAADPGPAVGAAAALGLGLVLFLSTGQSALQLAASDAARGRVMALWAMTLSGTAPVGHLTAGALAHRYGVAPVFAGMAAGLAAVAVGVGLGWLRWRPADGPATG